MPFKITAEAQISSHFHDEFKKLVKSQPHHFTRQFTHDLETAFYEGVTNAIRHAEEIKKKKAVTCELKMSGDGVELHIQDHGPGFFLEKIPTPKFEALSESGRGIFMMRQLMDEVSYTREQKLNTLILKRQFLSSDQQNRDLDLLHEISQAILEDSKQESLYQLILEKAVEVFQVQRASIMRFDEDLKKLKVVASCGMTQKIQQSVNLRPGEGIAGFVFQHTKPCLVEDMERQNLGWEQKKKYRSLSFMSAPLVVYPMQAKQKTIGVINLTDKTDGSKFSRRDLKLLTTIANQASAYLQMYELINEAREAEFLKKELDLARKIQQSYLPIKAPKVDGMILYGWLNTAQKVGGDYYDFIDCGAQGVYVVVADVSGHNIAAAITMANFRSHLKALLLREANPAKVLTKLNELLFEDLIINEQFITLVLIQLKPNSKKIKMARAGHMAPWLLRADEVTPMDKGVCGSILGLVKGEKYRELEFELQEHDKMLVYTDGVLDLMNEQGERFGPQRLVQYLSSCHEKKLTDLLIGLKTLQDQFRGNAPIADDVSVVGILLL